MNQCPYCNFESDDDYCPHDSTRMVLLQPKPKEGANKSSM